MTDADAEQALRQLIRDQLTAEAWRNHINRLREERKMREMMDVFYKHLNGSAHGTAQL